jgi:hypothetical protein
VTAAGSVVASGGQGAVARVGRDAASWLAPVRQGNSSRFAHPGASWGWTEVVRYACVE